jgi:hypothetical protein
MAFLRFHRDKRGYEHFYIVEATTTRRGKTRTRVLYWFRTPPNVKVGRVPFDEDVQRALEAQNPGISFDWRKISETPIPSADAERWRERRRQERAARAVQRASGEEPVIEEPEEDEPELPESAEPDLALDAAEQQADALEPTEESLVSTAATIESPISDSTAAALTSPSATEGSAEPQPPARPSHRRRRRRRRGRRRVPSSAPSHSAVIAQEEPREPREPGEPSESD